MINDTAGRILAHQGHKTIKKVGDVDARTEMSKL